MSADLLPTRRPPRVGPRALAWLGAGAVLGLLTPAGGPAHAATGAVVTVTGAIAAATGAVAAPPGVAVEAGDEGPGIAVPPGPSLEAAAAIQRLLYARRFTLDLPYTYSWGGEPLAVAEGWILVLAVDPFIAQPRDTDGAVLYAGPRPAEIVNGANAEGRVVAIAPEIVDLGETILFYGSPLLPEQVDGDRGRAELAAARRLGLTPPSATVLIAAKGAGGAPLHVADRDGLYAELAAVVAAYSPSEADLVRTLRLIPR